MIGSSLCSTVSASVTTLLGPVAQFAPEGSGLPNEVGFYVALAMAVNFIWFSLAIAGENLHPVIWIALTGTVTALYWSLVHEIIHGHPTSNKWVNYAFVWLPIGWVYALGR
ncbi:MAG: hypothetical protein HC869_16270, partial [Rhodospirillales bacterium]|nr:hypothetical protein [Rhodospirillales bacterium]